MEWLLTPIDPTRAHAIDFAVSWHARSMVLAWGILAPMAVLIARFFKVLPGQDWPRELDTQVWWKVHWMGNSAVLLLTVFGLGLIVANAGVRSLHGIIGYVVVALLVLQVLLGVFRGTKGGPTAPAADGSLRGDHYDMTPWRVVFEWAHKTTGYALLLFAAAAIVLGLWDANAPRWMWLSLCAFWAVLIAFAMVLQGHGRAVDTYQAIWGPSPVHPGNRRTPIGWGLRRYGPSPDERKSGVGADVRSD